MKISYIKNVLLKSIYSMADDPSPFVKNPGVDFTRNRKCTMSDLFIFLLTSESGSLNREIRRYFGFKNTSITKSALIQQRNKLNSEALPHLLTSINEDIPFKKRYKGYHLLAVDGSDVNVPPLINDLKTRVESNTSGTYYHQVHLNALYDVLEERFVDIDIQPRAELNERKSFISFIEHDYFDKKCIYTADRGFFSYNVLGHLLVENKHYLLRINSPEGRNAFLKQIPLPESEEFDIELDFKITRRSVTFCKNRLGKYVSVRKDRPFDFIPPGDKEVEFPVAARLVKIRLSDDNYEYLLTNLNNDEFSMNDLKELYHKRWGIETAFRFAKYTAGMNSFRSIKREFITQEIFARIILYNLTSALIQCVKVPETGRKLRYKVSVSDAMITCREFLIHKFKESEIKELLLNYLTDVRAGRKSQRKLRTKHYIPLSYRC